MRLLATSALLVLALAAGIEDVAAAPSSGPGPPARDTWTLLAAPPARLDAPVFALAVDPAGGSLLVGTEKGAIYRSTDGGTVWTLVRADRGHAVRTIAFSPLTPGLVMAGTAGGGILVSLDGGVAWTPDPGSGSATVRSIAFATGAVVAGTDRGVMVKAQGGSWTDAGLGRLHVSAVALGTAGDPGRIVAGADSTGGDEALPLYQLAGAGGASTWTSLKGPATGAGMVSMLAAGMPAAGSTVRPLLLGTGGGAFESLDGGTTWSLLPNLPATDFNLAAFVGSHPDRFYLGSDGGGSSGGGLWYSGDGGQTFRGLAPPVPSLTALAVTGAATPTVYAATFRPSDGAVMLWGYSDAGGKPAGPVGGVPGPAAAAPRHAASAHLAPDWRWALVRGREAPFVAVGAAAVLVLLLALISYLRGARV